MMFITKPLKILSTLHDLAYLPACFSKQVYRYKVLHNSLNYIQILTINVSFEKSVSALF